MVEKFLNHIFKRQKLERTGEQKVAMLDRGGWKKRADIMQLDPWLKLSEHFNSLQNSFEVSNDA